MGKEQGPEKWRMRAQEVRICAVQITDADCRRIILGIARLYDQMAEAAARIEECSAFLETEHIRNPFVLRKQRGEPRESPP